tara:strand:+ start:3917 stop:4027 length:111 start_codon:yes stop_codon:yes gene_type:complete
MLPFVLLVLDWEGKDWLTLFACFAINAPAKVKDRPD